MAEIISLGNIIGGLLGTLVIGATTWYLEEELEIKHAFKKIYARFMNSSAEIKANYNIETNIPFNELKSKAKKVFSNSFDQIKVKSSSENKLELSINESFRVVLRRENSEMISVGTNRMVTTARSIKTDFRDLNKAIEKFTSIEKERSIETQHFTEIKDISCYVYISTASSVFNIYSSKELNLKDYEFNLAQEEDNFKIKATNGHYQIIAENNEGISSGLAEIV